MDTLIMLMTDNVSPNKSLYFDKKRIDRKRNLMPGHQTWTNNDIIHEPSVEYWIVSNETNTDVHMYNLKNLL